MRYSILIERNISVNYKTNHKGNTFFEIASISHIINT